MAEEAVLNGRGSDGQDRGRQRIDRSMIVETAIALIEEYGDAHLTLTGIAAELGVTQPALYKHIDGLDDIWRELGLVERRELSEALTRATIGRSGEDAVRALAVSWCTFARTRPGLYRVGGRWPVAGDQQLEAAVSDVARVIESALRGFDLDADQVSYGARALRSALHGYSSFELVTGNPAPYNPDETLAHIVEVFIVGMRALADGTLRNLEPLAS